MATSNKRARGADILSSLDAAFASAGQVAASKYTSQAAARVDQAAVQQAYAHKRKRGGKKKPGNDSNTGSNSANDGKNGGQAKRADAAGTVRGLKSGGATEDPLYCKMDANLLSVGLRRCSLVRTQSTRPRDVNGLIIDVLTTTVRLLPAVTGLGLGLDERPECRAQKLPSRRQ